MNSILANYLALKHQFRTSARFRAEQSLNSYTSRYRMSFASSNILSTHASGSLAGDLLHPWSAYDIDMFHINILTSDLGVFYIPRLQCLRTTHTIKVVPGAFTILVTA